MVKFLHRIWQNLPHKLDKRPPGKKIFIPTINSKLRNNATFISRKHISTHSIRLKTHKQPLIHKVSKDHRLEHNPNANMVKV